MWTYIARRLVEAVITVAAVVLGTFLLLHLMPINLAILLAGPRASNAKIAAVAKALGLNLPLYRQFEIWMRTFGSGAAQLALHLGPPTLELLALGSLLAVLLAFVLAYIQSLRPRSFFDRASTLVAYLLYTLPSFWVGLVLIYIFAIDLTWLPGNGPNNDPATQGLANWLLEMTLPVVTLAVTTIATWSTHFRSAIDEALRSDYIRTARAKGLSEPQVVLAHVLRNAALPVITIAGMSLPSLFNNLIVVESVFNIQGLGSATVGALASGSLGTALALIMVIAVITVLGSLVADILLAFADPRIHFS